MYISKIKLKMHAGRKTERKERINKEIGI